MFAIISDLSEIATRVEFNVFFGGVEHLTVHVNAREKPI